VPPGQDKDLAISDYFANNRFKGSDRQKHLASTGRAQTVLFLLPSRIQSLLLVCVPERKLKFLKTLIGL